MIPVWKIRNLELMELGPWTELTPLASGRIKARTQVSSHAIPSHLEWGRLRTSREGQVRDEDSVLTPSIFPFPRKAAGGTLQRGLWSSTCEETWVLALILPLASGVSSVQGPNSMSSRFLIFQTGIMLPAVLPHGVVRTHDLVEVKAC